MVFTVNRLMKIKKTVGRKLVSQSSFIRRLIITRLGAHVVTTWRRLRTESSQCIMWRVANIIDCHVNCE